MDVNNHFAGFVSALSAPAAQAAHLDRRRAGDRGQRRIVLGPGSDYTAGEKVPSERIYMNTGDGEDRVQWPTPIGDILVTGQPGGHMEAGFTFQLMTG